MIKKYLARITQTRDYSSTVHEIEVQLDDREALRINNTPDGSAAQAYGKMFFPNADRINRVTFKELKD